MAERSKALRSGRSPLFGGVGWPSGQKRCVHVEVHSVLAWSFEVKEELNARESYFCVSGGTSALRRCNRRSPLACSWVRTSTSDNVFLSDIFVETTCKESYSACQDGRAVMAKRSKALRSCRSPLGFGMGSNPTSDNVKIPERSKVLRLGLSKILQAWF
ncbi:hypothetical protein TNCV_4801621 [Trichonephila clavipes]|nr:hypothetical protein TNCV_4801621 [Trichonephila clavipes]